MYFNINTLPKLHVLSSWFSIFVAILKLHLKSFASVNKSIFSSSNWYPLKSNIILGKSSKNSLNKIEKDLKESKFNYKMCVEDIKDNYPSVDVQELTKILEIKRSNYDRLIRK